MTTTKKQEDKSTRTTVSMPESVRKRLEEYCRKAERPFSWVVQKAVIEWLDKHEEAGGN